MAVNNDYIGKTVYYMIQYYRNEKGIVWQNSAFPMNTPEEASAYINEARPSKPDRVWRVLKVERTVTVAHQDWFALS